MQKPADSVDSGKERNWQAYTKRTFYLPFFLVTAAFFIGAFGGTATLQTFAVVIFEKLKAPIDEYTAAVFLGVAQLIGTMFCVMSIHFMGKRKLCFLSIAGSGLCFALTAIYGYLSDADVLDETGYTWIPTTLMIGAAFTSHTGIRLLPWILAGEVFPVKVRNSCIVSVPKFAKIYI